MIDLMIDKQVFNFFILNISLTFYELYFLIVPACVI